MKKRLKAFLTGLLLCVTLAGSLSVNAAAAGFQDVPANHWAASSIQRCVEHGFFKGQSADRFGLGQQMTRSAFTVVLCRFFGWETTSPTKATYGDVPVDAWYAGAVESAYNHGAITDQREHFRPNDPITREELTVILVRAMGYGTIAGLAQDLELPFKDVTTNVGYITMAYDLGLVNGTTATTFSPDKTATREQVAVILMRLYDKLHGEAPETVAIVSSSMELTGLDVAAIPAGRLICVSGKPVINSAMQGEEVTPLLEAVRQSGAQALLHVTGSSTALNGDAVKTADVLVEAVASGGYDGLFLNIPTLSVKKASVLTKLVKAVDAALGDKPLYVVAEAPTRQGKAYGGYDYTALAAAADHLVLRTASYEKTSTSFTTAPVDPLEEIYYALGSLHDGIDSSKLTLMVTTTPSAWSGKSSYRLTAEEFDTLLADQNTEFYYSDRYACAYLTGTSQNKKDLVVWYLDGKAFAARSQLARAFGVGQFCLTDWEAASQEVLSGLQ